MTSTPNTMPPPLSLNISENISPDAGVFILDNDKKELSSIDVNQWFFLQQKGLPKGTIYGFRVMNERGEVLMPVYEKFTAKTSDWIEQNKYYHNLIPGNLVVELLIINGGEGVVIARKNLTAFSFEKILNSKCGNLTNEPEVDADGWSREGKIGRCAAKVGVELGNVVACDLLGRVFNDTGAGFGECIISYAMDSGDISACDNAGMPKSRGFCRAKVTKDWTECRKISCDISCAMENLETQQDLCIQWYAIENRNSTLCNEIKSSAYNMKEICFDITSVN